VLRVQKTLSHHVIEKTCQGIVKTIHIEQTARLAVKFQLRPGEGFGNFFQGTQPARHGNEAVGQFSHHGFALVHVVDHVQFGDAAVRQLALFHAARDDADHLAVGFQNRLGNFAHQSRIAAPID
jgi:hypothetical protein